jgi:hypothetical protein
MGSESELVPSAPSSDIPPRGPLLVGEAREAVVVRQLRACIKFVVIAGLAVIALGYLPIEVIGSDYRWHIQRAGGDTLTFCMLVMLSAAPWVYRRPHWRRILAWMLWVPMWLMVLTVLSDSRYRDQWLDLKDPTIDPVSGVRPMIALLLGSIVFVVVVVMPLVRAANKYAPPPPIAELPGARVVR